MCSVAKNRGGNNRGGNNRGGNVDIIVNNNINSEPCYSYIRDVIMLVQMTFHSVPITF